ncbi:MAG: DUF5989 family protein [Planctomycetota bacterium]|jgi:hypothetical protein
MTEKIRDESSDADDQFARQAEQAPPGLLREYWHFLRYSKKWYMIPTIVLLLLLGLLVALSASGLMPFIYAIW